MGAVGVISGSSSKVNSDTKLTYSDDSGGGQMPKNIIDFEDKRRSSKLEYNMVTDAKGNVIETRKGGKTSVKVSVNALNKGYVYSHNHPREDDGVYGGTFSAADMNSFLKYNILTFRAVSKEGTYSITKTTDLEWDYNLRGKLLTEYAKFESSVQATLHKEADNAETKCNNAISKNKSDLKSGKITFSEYLDRNNVAQSQFANEVVTANNKMLTSLHNWLLNNQKTYKYTYGLHKA